MITKDELVAQLELEEAERKRIKIEQLKEWERTKPKRVKEEYDKIKAETEELILKYKSNRNLSNSAIGEEQVEAAELHIKELKSLGYDVESTSRLAYQTRFVGDGDLVEDHDSPMIPYLNYIIRW